MTDYCVVQLNGKQFKVAKGDKLCLDKLPYKENETFEVSDVLLTSKKGKIQVGQPLVKKAKVQFKLLENKRSKKLRVAKFRAKSRYRRVKGHRQHQSIVEVIKLDV